MKLIQGQCKKISKEVEDIDEIKPLIKKMVKICNTPAGKYTKALALAHCQVEGVNPKRFFVLNSGGAVINPKITEKKKPYTHSEGCYSYVFRSEKKVKRFHEITVEFKNIKGEKKTEELKGLDAAIFQHEIDHMNGKAIYCK